MAKPKPQKPRRVSDEEVRETVLSMCRQAGSDGSVRPEDVARAILPDHWRTLLKRVRLVGKQLARAGQLNILRKGQLADPDDFKGLIRLQITAQGLARREAEDSQPAASASA